MTTATRPGTLNAGLVAALLALTLTACQPDGVVHVTNDTGRSLIIYNSNADPKVTSRVSLGSVPANSTADINIASTGCQPYALDALDGNNLVARREAPTCMGDTWTINP